jgi:hypothetical protein
MMHTEPGGIRNVGGFAFTWARHLLRRPREVSPFTLEEGARIVEGDPAAPTGARIEGGGLRLNPGFVVDVRENRLLIREGDWLPVVGTINCHCMSGVGDCMPVQLGNIVICQQIGCQGPCDLILIPGQPSVQLSLRAPG